MRPGTIRASRNIRGAILANPAAWLWFALFLFAEYWNYQHGVDLDVVCEAIAAHEIRATSTKAQDLCAARDLADDEPRDSPF